MMTGYKEWKLCCNSHPVDNPVYLHKLRQTHEEEKYETFSWTALNYTNNHAHTVYYDINKLLNKATV